MSLRARILRYIEPKVAHCHVALELRVGILGRAVC